MHLTIELASDPIAGSVSAPGVQAHTFSGWIELVEAIEEARLGVPVLRPLPNGGAPKD